MEFNLEYLIHFLVRAKTSTYARGDQEVAPQRPGFKELEYKEGDWEYRDIYTGFYSAPGQEVVRYKGTPIWSMSYTGGMRPRFHGDLQFAERTFAFLKKALMRVNTLQPFRGPDYFTEGSYTYTSKVDGNVREFRGTERIYFRDEEVFRQDYIGGLVVHK